VEVGELDDPCRERHLFASELLRAALAVPLLSRFKFHDNKIDLGTEQKILQVNVNRGICCHVGGHIDFDNQGNLYLSTGDDTNPFESDGFAPIDERPARNPAFDAQRSAANTNDLRGKVLRIHVQDNGSYTIPAGNLFPQGTPKTRPGIYLMGLRNPFRIAVNRQNNDLYVADYSPDSPTANPLRGPAGTGKWFIARGPGNYGWPYCATDQLPYVDYDFATGVSGAPFNCAHPVNESPHNTGLVDLPPVKHPDVWYSYAASAQFPQLGTGGVGPMAGPAYHFDAKLQSRTKWPAYYDGQPLFYEWTRDYIKEFRLNSSGSWPISGRSCRRSRSTTRWTWSSVPTDRSTRSSTATGSSARTPRRSWPAPTSCAAGARRCRRSRQRRRAGSRR
jgi:cytochrome c